MGSNSAKASPGEVNYMENNDTPEWGVLPNPEVKSGGVMDNPSETLNMVAAAEAPLPDLTRAGSVQVKVPVVLAELTLQFDLETTIDLPEPALEIKRVQKGVKLTQCTLQPEAKMLFIQGFVRKNMEFATITSATPCQISGSIGYIITDIPFSTVAPIDFNLASPARPEFDTSQNFTYLNPQELPNRLIEKDGFQSGDLSEFDQISTMSYHDLPYCELVSSRVIEHDEFLDCTPVENGPFGEVQFTRIAEKLTVFLTIKIMQEQQVLLTPFPKAGGDNLPDAADAESQMGFEQRDPQELSEQRAESGETGERAEPLNRGQKRQLTRRPLICRLLQNSYCRDCPLKPQSSE